jgi:predicted porin
VDSGALYANRLGLRGSEDLGGGLSALFTLESGFNADDGSWGQGGLAFGRQAFVGLASSTWGQLTLGRQYDFLYAGSPLPLDVGALLVGGLAGASGGAGTAVDNHSGGVRYDNSAKWLGRFGPVTLGAMYGLGSEAAGQRQRMRSFVAAYRSGPLWAGIGHVRDNFSAPANGNKVTLASVNWNPLPAHRLVATLSDARAAVPANPNARSRMVQLGWLWNVTQPWMVGVMAGRADTRNAAGVAGEIRQWGLGTQYEFSRRTTLYAIGSRVASDGSAGTAYSGVPGIGAPPAALRSTTSTQNVLKAGLLHKF